MIWLRETYVKGTRVVVVVLSDLCCTRVKIWGVSEHLAHGTNLDVCFQCTCQINLDRHTRPDDIITVKFYAGCSLQDWGRHATSDAFTYHRVTGFKNNSDLPSLCLQSANSSQKSRRSHVRAHIQNKNKQKKNELGVAFSYFSAMRINKNFNLT